MRRTAFLLLSILTLRVNVYAQNPDQVKPGYSFTLPGHPGRLYLDAPSFLITEASAKPSGSEFGLRGKDSAVSIDLLSFLFIFPEEAPLTSEKCRDAILRYAAKQNTSLKIQSQQTIPTHGLPIAIANYTVQGSKGLGSIVRAFIAKDDLCANLEFSSPHPISLDTPQIKAALATFSLDPTVTAQYRDVFYYATVLFKHEMFREAAPIYEQALRSLPADDPDKKWLRVTTDQAAMAYGIAGDITKARTLLNAAVKSDPDYPLNYYNLACADAEQGDAVNAKLHLQQAFDRKANTIPGEKLPDPTKDDSILKLKSSKDFWAFVETLK